MQLSRKFIVRALLLIFVIASFSTWMLWGLRQRFPYKLPSHAQPQVIFTEPVTAEAIETTADALVVWRDFSDVKPALLIFSNKPLMPVPSGVKDEVSELLAVSGREVVRQRTARPSEPDTLLRPEMAVAAGLNENYFSRIVWVVSLQEGDELQLDVFVQKLRSRAPQWGEYLDTFHVEDGRIVGILAGTPVEVVTVETLPTMDGPLLLHVDMSYLLPRYKGEIKTPIYGLLRQLSNEIAARDYRVWSASVSRDNLTGDMPLDTRFFADELVRFMTQPELLKQAPQDELVRAEALYLVNFFKSELIYAGYQQLKELRPQDASVLYGEYKVLRDLRRPDEALRSLEQAVVLDSVYAYEYGGLSALAMEKKLVDKAFQQLDKAIEALPSEPFLRLKKAQLLLSVGRDEEARAILQELRSLPWSPHYYTEMRTEIERLL